PSRRGERRSALRPRASVGAGKRRPGRRARGVRGGAVPVLRRAPRDARRSDRGRAGVRRRLRSLLSADRVSRRARRGRDLSRARGETHGLGRGALSPGGDGNPELSRKSAPFRWNIAAASLISAAAIGCHEEVESVKQPLAEVRGFILRSKQPCKLPRTCRSLTREPKLPAQPISLSGYTGCWIVPS